MLLSILFIFAANPTAKQMDTAFVEKAVLKLRRGPISTDRHFFADDLSPKPSDVDFVRVLSKVGDNIHSSFRCSDSFKVPVVSIMSV